MLGKVIERKADRMKLKKLAVSPLILLMILALLSGCVPQTSDSTEPLESSSSDVSDREPLQTTSSDFNEPSDSSTDTAMSSITTDPQLSSLHKEILDNGYSVGMAFLGYVDEEAAENEMRSYLKSSQYAEKYAFLCDAPLADAGGTELYAVVPAVKECHTSVYRAKINDSGEYDVLTDDVFYDEKGADSFLLRCNISDIHSNAVISFENGDEVFSVFPMLSGMDGRLAAENCYDLTIYTKNDETEDKNVQIARELLIESDQVRERMTQGMSLLYTGEHQTIEGRDCWIFALGTEHGDQFVREYLYGVCDNLIYTYDVISDTWSVLGAD